MGKTDKTMNTEGVSVCITAYKAQDYIKECLDSVINQSWFKDNDNFEIIVGIDGCETTLEYMKTIMGNYKNLRVLMMDSNKGTYITSNTIISVAKYDNIFRFDSDDKMCVNLIKTVMENRNGCKLLRYRYQNFGCKNRKVGWAHGTIYISKAVFMKYGGFRPWPCGADSEIYYRLKNVEYVKNINHILMMRRIHETSLTHAKETGMNSDLRKRYVKMIYELNITKSSDAVIDMVTNTYKEVELPVDKTIDQEKYMETVKTINEPVTKKAQVISKLRKNMSSGKMSSIATLRKDIETGKLVRVPVVGGFVWKRIKS